MVFRIVVEKHTDAMVADALVGVLLLHWHTALVVTLVAYLLKNYFHNGLHKYPGPFLASITDWWRFYDVYKRRPELTHIRLHKKHGDVVRLGPNVLSFADPKALKTIYGLNKGFTKSEFYPVQQSVANGHRLPSLFSTTSEPFHAQLRRSVNSAFSMSTLLQYEPFVDNSTLLFLSQTEKLYARPNKVCDFSRWLQFYAFDVIGEMTYSKRHGFLEENRDIDGIIKYLAGLFDYVAPIGQIPLLDLLFLKNPFYLLASKYGLVDSTMPVAKFAQARIAERLSSKSSSSLPIHEKPDLLAKFMQAKVDRPEFMTDQLVMTMAVSMAFAGSETTAISLSSILYHLLKSPASLSTLQHELSSSTFAHPTLVSYTEAQALPYLNACILEAFRIHPAPGLLLERIVPAEGSEICGERVKGGTVVGCSAWVLHRRPEVFGEDVELFRPERWLVGGMINDDGESMLGAEGVKREEDRIKEMKGCLLQFGMGARTCIGKNISLLEVYKVVPALLRGFEIRFEHPEKEWTVHNAWFVRQLDFYTLFRKWDVPLGKVKETS